MMINLEQMIDFKCDSAIHVFIRKYRVSKEKAEDFWVETLKWLWLGRYHQTDFAPDKPSTLFIAPPLIPIDEMWDAFILCTKEYFEFCKNHFGQYLHHEPHSNEEGVSKGDYIKNYKYVLSVLGQETAVKWYITLPLIYADTEENKPF